MTTFISVVRPYALVAFICALMAAGNASGAATSIVRVDVEGIELYSGTLRAALVNSAEAYSDDAEPIMVQSVRVGSRQEIVFQGVPFGTYAVKIFHDENDNEQLDTNFIGIPTEKYGFSNNARSKLGLPDFSDVKFEVNAPKLEIAIKVANY